MKIEYCDRCGREIGKGKENRNHVEINVGGNSYHSRIASADIVLCKSCYDDLGVEEKVRAVYMADKEPNDVERFYSLFLELVKECVEELRVR